MLLVYLAKRLKPGAVEDSESGAMTAEGFVLHLPCTQLCGLSFLKTQEHYGSLFKILNMKCSLLVILCGGNTEDFRIRLWAVSTAVRL